MAMTNEELSKAVFEHVSKMNIHPSDVLLFNGNWEQEDAQRIAHEFSRLRLPNIAIMLPDGVSLEKMPISDFYTLMKHVEATLGLTPEGEDECTDGVSGD